MSSVSPIEAAAQAAAQAVVEEAAPAPLAGARRPLAEADNRVPHLANICGHLGPNDIQADTVLGAVRRTRSM